MAHINLLPWREEKRQERLKQFAIGTGLSVVLTAVLFYSVVLFVNSLITCVVSIPDTLTIATPEIPGPVDKA